MEESNINVESKNIQYPKKKFLDKKKDSNYIKNSLNISTNLIELELDKEELKDVYLFGCDIEEDKPSLPEEFNKVNIMRIARKLDCFKEQIHMYVTDYYISGLILIGRKIKENEKDKNKEKKEKAGKEDKGSKRFRFSFYLKIREFKDKRFEGIIQEKKPEYEPKPDLYIEKIYKFIFKQKEINLLEMSLFNEKENSMNKNYSKEMGNYQYIFTTYLNICLGKLLKNLYLTKDRASKKLLYYDTQNPNYGKTKRNNDFLYYPALKAVCEVYEYGKIYLKLLPKNLVKFTYENYFYEMKEKYKSQEIDKDELLELFRQKVKDKKAMRIYNQSFIKIDDVIYENPYKIEFENKGNKGKKISVGNYFKEHWNIYINDTEMPIAIRYIDQGGKLKGKDKIVVYIPCFLLEVIGNVFEEKIDIKKIIQNPEEKFNEIDKYKELIEKESYKGQKELNNYLGNKFEPLIIEGEVIRPPNIIFAKRIDNKYNNLNIEANDSGGFEFVGSDRSLVPYGEKILNKVDIYLLKNLNETDGRKIWEKIKLAGKELGVEFKENPAYYFIENYYNKKDFEEYINNYFHNCDDYYKKAENKTDFIFLFMDSSCGKTFHYRIFKSIINKFDWKIPTQVVLYDYQKLRNKNLSPYTNILCQIWAKRGSEVYICDFSFVPKTLVIAYSSALVRKNEKKILTSISVSWGFKLYEYFFYSEISEDESNETKISPLIKKLMLKALKFLGLSLNKNVENIVIYRDSVNNKQMNFIQEAEIFQIKEAIKEANEYLQEKKEKNKDIYKNTKWCLILVSKFNEIKLFWESKTGQNNGSYIENIPVGTIIDKTITHKNRYDFYLNSAASNQGTTSTTHYTVLYDDTNLEGIQIYKLSYYLSFLSYNTTRSIKIPAPLYFVTRRNKYTINVLRNEIINKNNKELNISL